MLLSGVYVPLITPFDPTGAVEFAALESLTHEVLEAGVSGVVALGTTAEPGSLSPDEQLRVLEVVGRACQERSAQLLVGANTVDAVRALRGSAGVTAALSLVPPFLRPGEAGVIAHFAGLAAAAPVPVVVYHIPYRTGQALSATGIRRLADLPGVIGIKYAVGGARPDFAVLGGDDAFISPLLALGAQGGILASAHLATEDFVDLVEAWHRGAVTRARALGHRLAGLSRALFAEPSPAVLKAVLHAQGCISTAAVRLPLLPASSQAVRSACQLVQEISAGNRACPRCL